MHGYENPLNNTETAKKTADLVEDIVRHGAQKADDRHRFKSSISAGISNVNTSSENASEGSNSVEHINSEGVGAYNKMSVDMTSLANEVVRAGENTMSESEAAHGHREYQHYAELLGKGTVTKVSGKAHVADTMYNRHVKTINPSRNEKWEYKDNQSPDIKQNTNTTKIKFYARQGTLTLDEKNKLQEMFGGPNNTYRIGTNRTGNVLNDYKNNMLAVEQYLEKRGVNAKNLSIGQIETAIKKQKLEKTNPLNNSGIRFSNDQDMQLALKEYLFLRQQEGKISQIRNSGGGLSGTAKAWVKNAVDDSDAYTGFETARTTAMTAKAGAWAVKGAAGGIANTAISSVELGTKVVVTSEKAVSKFNKAVYKGNNEKIAKWNARDLKFNRAADKINVYAGKGKHTVNSFTKTSITDKAKWVGKNTVGKTKSVQKINAAAQKIGTKFNPMRKKMNVAKNFILKHTKVLRLPFTAFSAIQRVATKLLLSLGGAFLAIVVVVVVGTSVLSIFPNCADSPDGNVENSVAQKTIDYLYSFQEAYEENIYRCEPGSDYAEKGLPSTWVLTDDADINATDSISDNLTAVYDNKGEIIGYNLSKYWGPADREYKADVSVGTYNAETKAYDYATQTMTISGIGGLDGDIGEYSSLTAEVDKNSKAYLAMEDKENTDVTVNFEYKGSSYSYKFTQSKASSYETDSGEQVTYSIDTLYKGFLCMAIAFTGNDEENFDFFSKYCKRLFDTVMEEAEITLITTFEEDTNKEVTWTYVDPAEDVETECSAYGYKPIVTLNIWIDDGGLQDLIKSDTVDNKWAHNNGSTGIYKETNSSVPGYSKWSGWFEPDGVTASEAQELALEYYHLSNDDWESLFEGLTFPGNTCEKLSQSEIDDIIEQIKTNNGGLSAERETFLRFALECVGRFYYKYGGGHPVSDLDNPPAGLDCSGFVSYALFKGGADATYAPRGASALASCYNSIGFGGNFDTLQPGTIIVKNGAAGGTTTSSNHVVIYLGYVQLENDTAPRPYCVECTTTKDAEGRPVSGVQLSSQNRINTIKRYKFARDPF